MAMVDIFMIWLVDRLFFSSRRSMAIHSAYALVAFRPDGTKTIKHLNSGQQTSKTSQLKYY